LKNARVNAIQAATSIDRLARRALFLGYMGGNTRVSVTNGSVVATVSVDDVRGFFQAPVYTTAPYSAASASLNPVSSVAPLAATINGVTVSIIGCVADGVVTNGVVSGAGNGDGNVVPPGLTTAEAKLKASYQALFAAMHNAGRAPTTHENHALASLHARITSVVPVDFQNRIIAGGSARPADLAFERNTWLRGAAPDPEGDAPHNERMRLLSETIKAQQGFEAATRAAAARNAHPGIPSFQPTAMNPRRGMGAHWHL
jgi:hypothetical protein